MAQDFSNIVKFFTWKKKIGSVYFSQSISTEIKGETRIFKLSFSGYLNRRITSRSNAQTFNDISSTSWLYYWVMPEGQN